MSRNHFLRAISACIICITMLGAGSIAAQGSASISGTAIDGRPGMACVPLAGAEVHLLDREAGFITIDSTVSGSDGTYAFSGVPSKALIVIIDFPGPSADPSPDGVGETPVGREITVAGSDLSGVNPLWVNFEFDENRSLLFDPCTGLNGGGETPGGGGETPGSGGETPGGGGETPGGGDETPGNGDETPGNGDETPGNGDETPGNGDEDNTVADNAFTLTLVERACADQSFHATWTGTNLVALEFSLSNTSDDWTSGWLAADPAAGSFTSAVDHHGYDKVVARATFADGTTTQVDADVNTCVKAPAPSEPGENAGSKAPAKVASLPSTGSGEANGSLAMTAMALISALALIAIPARLATSKRR